MWALSSYIFPITEEAAKVSSSCDEMQGPGISHWLSDHFNYRHWSFKGAVLTKNPSIYIDQCKHILIYLSLILFAGRYTIMQPMLLTYYLQLLSYRM